MSSHAGEQPHILISWARDFEPSTIRAHSEIAERNGVVLWGKFYETSKPGRRISEFGSWETGPGEVLQHFPDLACLTESLYRFSSQAEKSTLLLLCDPDPRGFTLHHATLHALYAADAQREDQDTDVPRVFSKILGEEVPLKELVPDYYFGGNKDRLAFKVRYWFLISDIQEAGSAEVLSDLRYFESQEWVPLRFSEPISYPAVVRPRMGHCKEGILARLRKLPTPPDRPTGLQEIEVTCGRTHQSLWTHETAKHPHQIELLKLASQIPDDQVRELIHEYVGHRGFRHLKLTNWLRYAQSWYDVMVFVDTAEELSGRVKTPYGWQNFTAY